METLEQVAGQVRRQAVADTVRRTGPGAGVKPDVLLDSRSFADATAALDPGSPDFDNAVATAMSAAVAADPRFRAVPQPAPAAAGTPGQPRQWTLADVKAHAPSEVAEAVDAGLLRDLGCPPSRKRR
jgi:hypothetical protein